VCAHNQRTRKAHLRTHILQSLLATLATATADMAAAAAQPRARADRPTLTDAD